MPLSLCQTSHIVIIATQKRKSRIRFRHQFSQNLPKSAAVYSRCYSITYSDLKLETNQQWTNDNTEQTATHSSDTSKYSTSWTVHWITFLRRGSQGIPHTGFSPRLYSFGGVVCLQPEVLRLQFFQPSVLQMTTFLLNLAGVAHVVDAALAGYSKSVPISSFRPLKLLTLSLIGPHCEQSQWLPG